MERADRVHLGFFPSGSRSARGARAVCVGDDSLLWHERSPPRWMRNGLRFALLDYPRARISPSNFATASRSSAGAGAFFFVRDGFGVVFAIIA